MSERFKIGYFADGPWGHNALRILEADPTLEVCFVCVRHDHQDAVLREMAAKSGIPCYSEKRANAPVSMALFRQHNCDLFISMSFNQIFKRPLFSMPQFETINCHAGKLPFYRGRNILNWALINDEKEFGITVHHIDEGIDTGDIVLQSVFPIRDSDSYSSLLKIAYEQCPKILYDATKQIQHGTAKRKKQVKIDSEGSYCRRRGLGDENINWQSNTRQLFNFIRAISAPGPGARTIFANREFRIEKAEPGSPVVPKMAPGTVVSCKNNRLVVKTTDGSIELTEWVPQIKLDEGDLLE